MANATRLGRQIRSNLLRLSDTQSHLLGGIHRHRAPALVAADRQTDNWIDSRLPVPPLPAALTCSQSYGTIRSAVSVRAIQPSTPAAPRTRNQTAEGGRGRIRRLLAPLPTVGVALLPKVACPACWPAYAGALGAIGLDGLLEESLLKPLTLVFVGVAVAIAVLRAWQRSRRSQQGLANWAPVLLTMTAGTAIALGKFIYDSEGLLYAGVAGFISSSFWTRRQRDSVGASTPSETRGHCCL